MTATVYDFTIEQGADIDFTVQVWADSKKTIVQPLTGYDARMMIRTSKEATGSPLVSLTSNPAAGLTVNGPAGQVTVYVPGLTTTGYTWFNGVYDIEVFNGSGVIKRIAQGSVSVSAEVTH
jgi:hypothetical protein